MLKRLRKLFRRGEGRPSTAEPSVQTDRTRSAAVVPAASAPPAVHYGPRVVHRPIPGPDLDLDAVKIVQRLTRFDHTAYLVGGCVRDLLLEHKPKDFDVGTSATPRQIRRLFRNCRIIGRRFRLAHIYFQNGKVIEVATFRARDGDARDGEELEAVVAEDRDLLIREDNVFGTAEEDALRRDFTINSLFYDVNNETVLDHAEGLDDLRRKLIRTIGDPETRFREDPIRILRAIRFAARLDFGIEPGTLAALDRTRGEIPKAAAPRILEEINRFSRGNATRRSFELLRDTRVFDVILPELTRPYADSSPGWPLLLGLLQAMDAQANPSVRESRTGKILAALLAWPLCERIGWNAEGEARAPRGLTTSEMVAEMLRPIALRLRIPRRDQEQCRQILTMLSAMVPVRQVRPGMRRALLRREGFPEALWILEGLAAGGGALAEARAFWLRSEAEEAGLDRRPEPEGRPETEIGQPVQARRRSRRRGRRGGSTRPAPLPSGTGNDEPGPAPREQRSDLPPPWDDRYFFAALPSVPEIPGEEGEADRYGADALAGRAAEPEQPAPAEPARRRRRSRRRRRGGGTRPENDGGGEGGQQGPPDGTG